MAGILACLFCDELNAKVADDSYNECARSLCCSDDYEENFLPDYLKDECWSISCPCENLQDNLRKIEILKAQRMERD